MHYIVWFCVLCDAFISAFTIYYIKTADSDYERKERIFICGLLILFIVGPSFWVFWVAYFWSPS